MLTERPSILVYNPVSGHGHLDSWNAMFVALLLERGWRVLALTPDVGALLSRLEQKGLARCSRLQVLKWNAHQSRLRVWLHELWRRWDHFGDRYLYQRSGSEATPDLPFREYFSRRLCQAVVPLLFRATHFLYRRYRHMRMAGDQTVEDDPEYHLACPVDMSRSVQAALKKAKWKPTLAFNMYMDTYRTSQTRWSEFAAINNLSWAGIRFVPPTMPEEAWYSMPQWRGMCLLDESVCRVYSATLPDKYFSYLPDITEPALPEQPSAIVQEIHRRANGRKIVFLGGSIGGQKNLARWLELIGLADPECWFFVQIGEIHRDTLTDEDRTALDKALAAPPENLLIHAEYLSDERVFNEVIDACDVIFAVYRNFRISSNMLGKAAHFCKPILVSERYLLGERVSTYGIGFAVDEDKATAMLEGLVAITVNPVPRESFSRYCADFSPAELAVRLEDFLFNCLK